MQYAYGYSTIAEAPVLFAHSVGETVQKTAAGTTKPPPVSTNTI